MINIVLILAVLCTVTHGNQILPGPVNEFGITSGSYPLQVNSKYDTYAFASCVGCNYSVSSDTFFALSDGSNSALTAVVQSWDSFAIYILVNSGQRTPIAYSGNQVLGRQVFYINNVGASFGVPLAITSSASIASLSAGATTISGFFVTQAGTARKVTVQASALTISTANDFIYNTGSNTVYTLPSFPTSGTTFEICDFAYGFKISVPSGAAFTVYNGSPLVVGPATVTFPGTTWFNCVFINSAVGWVCKQFN
jgi:hypothetical protein